MAQIIGLTSIPEAEARDVQEFDGVLIVGSGPMGATYAKKLVEAGVKVLMVDVGAQETKIPGDHKKNVITFQKNMNSFIHVIQGELQKLSVPTGDAYFPTLDPSSYPSKKAIWNGQNPRQVPALNLEASAVTRTVGGMAAHWTCCTPEPHRELERPDCFSDEEWKALYIEARKLIGTRIDANGEGTEFEDSIRQQLVKLTLRKEFKKENEEDKEKKKPIREFKAMPLACERRKDNPDWVEWASSLTVWNQILEKKNDQGDNLFTIRAETQCRMVARDPMTGEIIGARLKDLRTTKNYWVKAKKYVIAAGAVLTPQILAMSGFESHLPALGRYMTEQTMTFCQIVLKESLLKDIPNDPFGKGWDKIAKDHMEKYPDDPLPIPFRDPDPQVTQPLTVNRPWHTQIHRDAFSYGLVPETYDQRAIVDLRWFGYVEPNKDNRVEFAVVRDPKDANNIKPYITDHYGMCQPTFYYTLSEDDKKRAGDMMNDMVQVAGKLGGFLPGALPQFMPPGAALHICGTTRVGTDVETSCVDKNSRVHGSNNLFLGGCNVIPTQIACNPTLTAMCFAIKGAEAILADLAAETVVSKSAKPTNGVDGTNGVNGANGH